MQGHDFSFSGGDKLSKIGATWFVSYMYYLKIDSSHKNWMLVDTLKSRINMFDSTTKYHGLWLHEVLKMSDNKLNTNKIKVSAKDAKTMASQLIQKL